MSKEELERAIREFKFKDASTQIDVWYCIPCVETAQKVNLGMYINLLIDQDAGEVIGCASGS